MANSSARASAQARPPVASSTTEIGDMAYYYVRAGNIAGIAMDMTAPYGVYLNGQCVGIYDTEPQAHQHFEQLRTSLRNAKREIAEEALA